MDHKEALEILLRSVLEGHLDMEGAAEAKAHVIGCPECLAEFAAFSAALTGHPSPLAEEAARRLSCTACLDRLPEYVEREQAGEDVKSLYPAVFHHLRVCSECARKYALLREVVGEGKPIIAAPQYPSFDELWLLQQTTPRLKARLSSGPVKRGRDYLAWLGREIEQGVSLVLVRLADVLTPPRPAYAHRGVEAGTEGELLAHFSVGTEELADFEGEIYVYREREDPTLCRALVQVSIPSRWPDFSGTQVVMTDGQETRSAQTGPDGRVVFTDIPVEALDRIAFALMPPE